MMTMRVGHHGVIAGIGAIPFQHGEFRQMQVAALAVAEHPGEFEDLRSRRPPAISCRRIPARCADSAWRASPSARDQFGARRMQMGLVAGRDLQDSGLDLGKALLVEPCRADARLAICARAPTGTACGSACRAGVHQGEDPVRFRTISVTAPCPGRKSLASTGKISMLPPETACYGRGTPLSGSGRSQQYQENSFESHRQFYPQGQRHRARRQALRRSDRREHPSRQGHPGQPDRNAPNQRRREDFRALQDHRPGREGDHRGPQLQLPLRGRRRLSLHEYRQLRPGSGAEGRDRRRRALSCRRT